jgi:hypothetical protein
MSKRIHVLAGLALAALVAPARAERPPQSREKADLVVVGKIEKITPSERKFGNDGVVTDYKAVLVVEEVERGKGVKAGERITVGWFRVTKNPSKLLPGAYGHGYPIKAKDKARLWLMTEGKKGWAVIYNSKGVEKLKK